MTRALLCFAAGVIALQLQPVLPAPAWLGLLPAGIALVAWRRRLALPVALATGFLWAAGFAHLRLADRLAPELEGRDLDVVGVIASLPAYGERSIRFEFEVESSPARLPRRILLSWYRSPPDSGTDALPPISASRVHPGERWRFTVRLRRPHGQLNPHGFDYEAWLLERGIGATGYVRPRAPPLRLGLRDSAADRIEQARDTVRERFTRMLGATPAAGILAALAVGDQRSISNEEWRLFSRTGVTHLMSISGLHVTMISGLFAWLVAALWRRVPALALRLPARKAAAPAAIVAAFGYALMAGFAVPAQRTFWMVTVVALALWSGRIVLPARTLALALGVVLAFDPWAVLSAGFWLSYGAVALIFYVVIGSRPRSGRWLRLGQALRTQWAITAGLAPATLFLFAQVSVVGPLANAVAIPLVSGVITPVALLAAALPAEFLAQLGAWLTEWLLQFLEACAMLPAALWRQHAPPLWSVLLALAGALWLIAPRGVPWRAGGLALMAPAFALPPPAPAPGEAWITTLDVGQGLAVVVRTANRTLLYDAGPQFGADADSGERIVAPYLQAVGTVRLDALVVTHNDTDHSGGAAAVIANFDVDELLSSLPPAHPLHAMLPVSRRCIRGAQWQWDGVRFALLHPAAEDARARRANNLSCVLRVSTGTGSVLLTGDIERVAEEALLGRGADTLRADVLLVPHHGSRTSSSAAFVAAVRPRFAVIPVGYRNRFGHPEAEVLERYAALDVRVLRTDLDGAITVRLGPAGVEAEGERMLRPRYWRSAGASPPGAGG
ncbi:MAG: DNA internalization-related competence protein ComEC/Rec2 [Betaproteobacteria bacterium]|nr:MAG: DNA internalization-related competence protein ComEC/Rec2 [Betaproteobacteria bacterium]